MSETVKVLMAAMAAALLAGCEGDDTTGPGRTTEEFDWRGTVAQGDRIEIENIAGNVRASFTAGDEVVVHAIKTGRDSDPASVTIEVVHHADGVTICAVYPDVAGMRPNDCQPGFGGNMTNRGNDVTVEFELMVPAGVEFVARVTGGAVEAEGLHSDVFVITVGGDITVSTTGIAAATSVSGSIDVVIGEADPDRNLAFRTTHGDVTVQVPSNTNAAVIASTSSGSVESSFDLEGTRTRKYGTLGSGGPNLWLSTLNGNVNLRRGSPDQQ